MPNNFNFLKALMALFFLGHCYQFLQAADGNTSFAIGKPPTTADWQYLQRLPASEQQSIWQAHTRGGKELKDWVWQWRIGWMKACGQERKDFCQDILRQGLRDHAMVVRAEAAWSLGLVYEGTHNQDVLTLLTKAYAAKENLRKGKPLLVQYRILYAINRIGKQDSQQVGKTLANQHPRTINYWNKLQQTNI